MSLLVRLLRQIAPLALFALLGGCSADVISPGGDVAVQERNLIYASTGLMLLIIVPVMVATLVFAWRYRATNTKATYDPSWDHSTTLEVLIWTAPLLIIIALGALTWISTHTLDPFRTIRRIDPTRPVAAELRPLTIEVVALDWKWLFFYPDQGIATVNEVAAPVDVPINFKITSGTVMNSFFIPALSGQVYAMAGMETRLHAVANERRVYNGFSAQYSGAGFSHMNFQFHAMGPKEFESWVAKVKADGQRLDRKTYLDLARPSEEEPIRHYASTEYGLYEAILNMCAQPGKMCQNQMMQIDAAGGAGRDSEGNYERLKYDGAMTREGNEAPGATFPASGRPPNTMQPQPQGMRPRTAAPEVNEQKTQPDDGQGHNMQNMPGMNDNSPAPAQIDKH